jgi:hypothetical protein
MESKGYIRPTEYYVTLSDIKHEDLEGPIAERLEVKYLKPEHNNFYDKGDIKGILYGTNHRLW